MILMLFAFSINLSAQNNIKKETVIYKDGDQEFEGYLAYDPSQKGKKPAVIVIHEWIGVNDYTKKRCDQLAEMGYVAFAADIYGKGIRPNTPETAGKESGKYRADRPLMRKRINLALEYIRKNQMVDPAKIAAIGYCFGGTVALELARSGADVKGVVSFHGGLNTPTLEDAKNIKGKVLVFHGAVDPFVPQEEVNTFCKEMNDAKVDYFLNTYANAVHSFTNPDAMSQLPGVAYNKEADERSFEDMKQFFAIIFK
jgi:dienelactone hydrolase